MDVDKEKGSKVICMGTDDDDPIAPRGNQETDHMPPRVHLHARNGPGSPKSRRRKRMQGRPHTHGQVR